MEEIMKEKETSQEKKEKFNLIPLERRIYNVKEQARREKQQKDIKKIKFKIKPLSEREH